MSAISHTAPIRYVILHDPPAIAQAANPDELAGGQEQHDAGPQPPATPPVPATP